MTLKGQVHGNNRTDLTKQAIDEAIRYYDTECVTIWLSRETANTNYIDTGRFSGTELTAGPTTYSADYEADIKHRWGVTTDAQAKCLDCGLQLTDDRAMLKKIADQYQADADHLREVKAQAWQDGHDTALLHGQSQNPYEGDPQ